MIKKVREKKEYEHKERKKERKRRKEREELARKPENFEGERSRKEIGKK